MTAEELHASSFEKRAAEEGDAWKGVRLRGLGSDAFSIVALEVSARKSVDSQKAIHFVLDVSGLQKSVKSLEALNTQDVSPELVRFVGELKQAYRQAGEQMTSYDEQQLSGGRQNDSDDDNAGNIRRSLDLVSQLQDGEGPLLQQRLSSDLQVVFGPFVKLSPEQWNLVSGEAASESCRRAAIETDADKLWKQYEWARANGGAKKPLRHIIRKFYGLASAERAQSLLDEMRSN